MKANEFVKKFGWGEIQGVVTNADSVTTHVKVYEHDTILIDYIHWDGLRISIKENGEWVRLTRKYQNAPDFICINDLKRLIESHDLVESNGGLYQARKVAHKNCFDYPVRLLQAIADVESCQ